MRVLVCGSRTFDDLFIVDTVLDGFYTTLDVLIEGECKGADSLAASWAERTSWVTLEPYPAEWGKYGKAAGPIRNQEMLDAGDPDLVIAFVDKPLATSKGAADMVRRAKAAGLPVYVVEKL